MISQWYSNGIYGKQISRAVDTSRKRLTHSTNMKERTWYSKLTAVYHTKLRGLAGHNVLLYSMIFVICFTNLVISAAAT